MIDPTQPLEIAPENKSETNKKHVGGFNTHPENINKVGRPKKDWTWAQLIEEAAEEIMEIKDKEGKVTARKALKYLVARKLLVAAAGGNVNAARELMNRTDGMPLQATDITSLGEKLIAPHVTVDTKPEEYNGK